MKVRRPQLNPAPVRSSQLNGHLLVPPISHRKAHPSQQFDQQPEIRPAVDSIR
ncbi:hypothetical protein [Kribbella sp. NPDC006257]|uniref:hypothetical protein n=1 Tax=Kribbella sp. NPDC006257 TaxID=3156738 RepID=UPI0033B6CA97